MERVVSLAELVALVKPSIIRRKGNGSLRRWAWSGCCAYKIYFLQQWFNLSDPAVEDALYQSPSMRGALRASTWAGSRRRDETTVCKFRHLLERHRLAERLFAVG